MKTYLVGGAVRDRLLNIESSDKDYVVTGATEEDMLKQGYIKVGRDFPVFIHPKTKEEYALARTERKAGTGYKGFIPSFSTKTTLEEDLKRRDLTINAIAFDGKDYIDPFNGIDDLKNKILRPVSESFKEDPLRVLRLARFKARFPDFSLHPLCYEMVYQTKLELTSLKKERIRLEIEKAFKESRPSLFFKTLKDLDVFDTIFASFFSISKLNDNQSFLDLIRTITNNPICLYAAFLFDVLNKNKPYFLNDAKTFLTYFSIQKGQKFILNFLRTYPFLIKIQELSPSEVLEILNRFKLKHLKDDDTALLMMMIDGLSKLYDDPSINNQHLKLCLETLQNLDYRCLDEKDMKKAVYELQLSALTSLSFFSKTKSKTNDSEEKNNPPIKGAEAL